MDKINGLNQIVKVLQSKIGKSNQKSRTGKATTNKKNDVNVTSKDSITDLEINITSKIAALNKNSSNYKQSAVNIFVEEVLHWEFSSEVTLDPEFSKLKEKITIAFKESESLDSGFEQILSLLKK